jgi:hypothetical protein
MSNSVLCSDWLAELSLIEDFDHRFLHSIKVDIVCCSHAVYIIGGMQKFGVKQVCR